MPGKAHWPAACSIQISAVLSALRLRAHYLIVGINRSYSQMWPSFSDRRQMAGWFLFLSLLAAAPRRNHWSPCSLAAFAWSHHHAFRCVPPDSNLSSSSTFFCCYRRTYCALDTAWWFAWGDSNEPLTCCSLFGITYWSIKLSTTWSCHPLQPSTSSRTASNPIFLVSLARRRILLGFLRARVGWCFFAWWSMGIGVGRRGIKALWIWTYFAFQLVFHDILGNCLFS